MDYLKDTRLKLDYGIVKEKVYIHPLTLQDESLSMVEKAVLSYIWKHTKTSILTTTPLILAETFDITFKKVKSVINKLVNRNYITAEYVMGRLYIHRVKTNS